MIVERGFPLLRRINEILSALRDMGLMSKMFVDFKYNMTILTPIREMKVKTDRQLNLAKTSMGFDDEQKEVDDDPEIVLTVDHLEGAFTLLLAGLVASSAFFLLEIIFHSKVIQKIAMWIWRKVTCRKETKRKVTFKKTLVEVAKEKTLKKSEK